MTPAAKPADAILVADDLHKSYRRRQVVRGVSIVVHAGEIVGLLGPNGAGKTTTFNMVAGILPSDRGRVWLGTQDLGRAPLYQRARRGLGYLPQESTVFRGLSVYENLQVVFEAQRFSKHESHDKAEALLQRYNLKHVRDNLGSQLSGGERRRLEMARVLIPNPRVVLLDEPFAGVDPIAVREIKGFIEDVRRSGIGVLLTDHNVRETLGICDRAYLISDGKILMSGTPEQIVANKEARETYLGTDFKL